MNERLSKFKSFKTHPWFGRIFKKINSNDILFAESFIEKNEPLNKGEFEFAVNRLFLDRAKPKAWKEIVELLTCCNS